MHDEKLVKEIASERISRLLTLAKELSLSPKPDPGLERKYVRLARKISAHYKVSMPAESRKEFCKACNSLLIPGRNCTVRLVSSHGYVVYRCVCGHENKFFYTHKAAR